MTTDTDNPQGLNLLSLDGGGIIGLSSLFIIREIMDRIQAKDELPNRPRPCDHFDLIAGTGTGAIFAVMLGRLKMSVDDAIQAYCHLMSEVHSAKKSIMRGDSKTLRTARLEQGFKAIVEEVAGDAGEMMMEEDPNEAKCKVVIYARPTRNMNASLPFAFRSYPASVSVIPDCPIWKALRASTAHPDLFKCIEIEEIGEGHQFIDGSYACSNPTPLLLEEISVSFPRRLVASVVSIGAGHSSTIQVPQSGWLGWPLSTSGSPTAQALRMVHGGAVANEIVANNVAARISCVENVYHRLNVDEGIHGIETDEWKNQSEVGENTGAYLERKEISDQLDKLISVFQERPTLVIIQPGGHMVISSNAISTNLKYCPCSTPTFRGCKPQLEKANRYFKNEGEAHQIFVIHGSAGAGKTQMALKFAEQMAGRSVCFASCAFEHHPRENLDSRV